MDDLTIGDHFAAFVGGSALVDPARDDDAHNASSCQTGGPRRCTSRHRCFMRRERGTGCVQPVDVRLGMQGCSKLLKGESPAVHTLNSPVTNFRSYLQEQGAHPESLLPRAQQ